jgi:hypothetical protein
MNQNNYRHLLSEKTTLEQLITQAPATDFIGRMSLQSRLKNIQKQIDSVEFERLTKKAIITFRGKPVDGSHGITAEFTGKAIESLNNMVASIVASQQNLLKYHGAIPNREQNALMITGTAVGSFGFEFELPSPTDDLFADRNGTENALSTFQQLVQYGIDGTDDQISDMLDNIHPRAIKKTTEFLEVLHSHQAVFAVQFEETITRINDDKQLQHIMERLSVDNIQESEESYEGKFLGVLPNTRTFEFRPNGYDILIKGKIDRSIENPEILNSEYLNRPLSVVFHVSQFGQAKPKYLLKDIESIS